MLLLNSKEAEQLFRYANEMFTKAKSNIRNQRNVATEVEVKVYFGIPVVILTFPIQIFTKKI